VGSACPACGARVCLIVLFPRHTLLTTTFEKGTLKKQHHKGLPRGSLETQKFYLAYSKLPVHEKDERGGNSHRTTNSNVREIKVELPGSDSRMRGVWAMGIPHSFICMLRDLLLFPFSCHVTLCYRTFRVSYALSSASYAERIATRIQSNLTKLQRCGGFK
jgi:hypothetical protein